MHDHDVIPPLFTHVSVFDIIIDRGKRGLLHIAAWIVIRQRCHAGSNKPSGLQILGEIQRNHRRIIILQGAFACGRQPTNWCALDCPATSGLDV